jgi:ABC-type sulfate transport system permease subunit
MYDAFMNSLATYYGADWLAMFFGFSGAWLVTNKNKHGFVLTIISLCFAVTTAVIAGQFGFIMANLINMAIAVRGFVHWRRDEKQALRQDVPHIQT